MASSSSSQQPRRSGKSRLFLDGRYIVSGAAEPTQDEIRAATLAVAAEWRRAYTFESIAIAALVAAAMVRRTKIAAPVDKGAKPCSPISDSPQASES